MRKFLLGVTLMSLLLAGCDTTSGTGGLNQAATKSVTSKTVPSGGTIPSDAEVKSMTASVSILPGSKKKTFTNTADKATIDRILSWLGKSIEVGLEKPPIGNGGYPPTLEIALNDGNSVTIGPAQNWSLKKLSNGNMEISGADVEGYVVMATTDGRSSKVVRLYSPELYQWIVKHEWE